MIPSVLPSTVRPTPPLSRLACQRPCFRLSACCGRPRIRLRIRPQVISTVGAPKLDVPQKVMPRSAQAAASMPRLRSPVVISSFRLGSFSISARGKGVRSRIARMPSKGSRRATSLAESVRVSRNAIFSISGSPCQASAFSVTP